MSNLKIAVQMDNPWILDKESDSTFAIIEEALKRDYDIYIYTVDDLSLKENVPVVVCKKIKKLNIKEKKFLQLSNETQKNLSSFTLIQPGQVGIQVTQLDLKQKLLLFAILSAISNPQFILFVLVKPWALQQSYSLPVQKVIGLLYLMLQ